MASVSESAAVSGRTRRSEFGIELAGDRAASRARAARHSSIVRALRAALPLSALGVAGLYTLMILKSTGWGVGLPSLDIPTIIAENLAMENPHYEGFNKDGGRYWVTAKKAMQDVKNLSVINLDAITGELSDAEKKKTKLTAIRGTFNNKANILELFDSIDIAGDNGLKAHLTRATIRTKENVITSDQPVVVMMEAGNVKANQLTVRQKTKEYIFTDKVRTTLSAQDATGAPPPVDGAQQKPALPFGNSKEAINIVSQRLDVNDAEKSAVFTGSVKATQGVAWLTSPELAVTYEGSAASGTEAKPEAGPGQPGKVKRVVAKNPVVLSQGEGQQAASQSADFDALQQKAVLEGDVVLTEAPDKRATGDRAEIDQAGGTVLLTGTSVVLTQGSNELRGRRLFFNQTNGKMQLTGNGEGGNSRIKARFSETGGKTAPAAKEPVAAKGMSLGGNFKTDPNAPVDVDADRLDVDDPAKEAVFTGSVRAKQGDFVLQSAELKATYTGSSAIGVSGKTQAGQGSAKLTRLKANKNVVVTSADGQKATGDWADFDTKANTVTLGGNVIMTQGKNVVRGTKLVIDMTTGESIIPSEGTTSATAPMHSGEDGDSTGTIVKSGRPSATFYPSDIKEKSGKAVEKAGAGWQARETPSPKP